MKDFAAFVDALGPTAIGLANNHCRDFGEAALMDTIDLLQKKKYLTGGAGRNIEDAYQPILFEKDSVRVAILAVCENEPGVAEENIGGSAGYNLSRVSNAIFSLKQDGYLPIIFFHGGNEQNPFPSPEKVGLYRHFIDLGARSVIAMHTHCPQGYEVYKGCPIVYSMGNFFFPSEGECPSWYYGYMTQLEISGEQVSIEAIPYKFDFGRHEILAGEEKEHFLEYLRYITGVIRDDRKIREYFDSWCVLPDLHYLREMLKYSEEMLQVGATAVMGMKNVLCCEAHNELIRNTFKIIYDGRFKAAGKYVEEIKRLQQMQL